MLRIGIENNNDGRSIAWALEHPGCFAYGVNAAQAEAAAPASARGYAAWVRGHGGAWADIEGEQVSVEEIFDAHVVPAEAGAGGTYLVESFFQQDSLPLVGVDVERGLKLLHWSRADLMDVVRGVPAERLNETYPGERWSINGILKHVAGAEWWYQFCIHEAFPAAEDDLPPDPIESLELVRAHFASMLPRLQDSRGTFTHQGEVWSPRKVLRRALWHERDHTQHIRKLLDDHAG